MKDSLIVVEARIELDEKLTLPSNCFVLNVTKESKSKKSKVSAYVVGTKLLVYELNKGNFKVQSIKLRPWYKLQYLEFAAEFADISSIIRNELSELVISQSKPGEVNEDDSQSD